MALTKIINSVEHQMSAKEETDFLAHTADLQAKNQVRRDAEAQKVTDKGTGNQKLLDLGLTQAEVDALVNK